MSQEKAKKKRNSSRDRSAKAGIVPASSTALGRFDPLQAYMHEVQNYPVLNHEDQQALAVRYLEDGDLSAAAQLVTSNLRLVVKIAYEYRRSYRNILDLVQEGNIGLMQAVKKYDPYRGVKLSTYAAWWIRAYILRYVLNNWRLVKLGTTQAQRKLFFNLNKERAKLIAMGIEATPEELASRLNVKRSEVVQMDRRLSAGEVSLDAPIGDDESQSRIELLPSQTQSAEEVLVHEETDQALHTAMQEFARKLKDKDAIIFQKRLIADDPLTLQQLGDRFGISRERVRQLEQRIQRQLKKYLEEQLGDGVLDVEH